VGWSAESGHPRQAITAGRSGGQISARGLVRRGRLSRQDGVAWAGRDSEQIVVSCVSYGGRIFMSYLYLLVILSRVHGVLKQLGLFCARLRVVSGVCDPNRNFRVRRRAAKCFFRSRGGVE